MSKFKQAVDKYNKLQKENASLKAQLNKSSELVSEADIQEVSNMLTELHNSRVEDLGHYKKCVEQINKKLDMPDIVTEAIQMLLEELESSYNYIDSLEQSINEVLRD
jgi:hypothetical protein